jgi:putative membrane protein
MTALNLLISQMNGPRQMMDGWGGFGMIFMGLIWLLLLALLVTLIWSLIRKGSNSTSQTFGESPREILSKRYARGNIDEEEYQRKKKIINE